MAKPTSIDLDFSISIHRHNGRDDDDCEVSFSGGEAVRMRPNALRAYLLDYVDRVVPANIKDRTGIDVLAARVG